MQGAAAALVDSRTRRIVPGAAFVLHKNSLKVAAYLEAVEDGCVSVLNQWTSVCTTNTFVAGEGGRSVRDWASPQSLCNLCLWL